MAQTDDFPFLFGKETIKVSNRVKTAEEVRKFALQKKIIDALEAGKDTSALQKELRELKMEIIEKKELEDLKVIADEKKDIENKATEIIKKVAKQSNAIDDFLKKRDSLTAQIKPLIKEFQELAKLSAASWEKEPGQCYIFNDIGMFAAAVRDIKSDYLPADFGCAFLRMQGGRVDAMGKTEEALQYFVNAFSIIDAMEKGEINIPLQKAEGLLSLEKKEKKVSK